MEETTTKTDEMKRRFRDIFVSEIKNSQTWPFWFCLLWTICHITMMWVSLISLLAYQVPEGMTWAYASLLGAYTTGKEVNKWVGKKITIAKPGELMVYAWWISLLLMYVVIFRNATYKLPQEMDSVCFWVLGIFFGGETSKILRSKLGFKQRSTDTTEAGLAEKK